jgi:excisionase family DNA binding protein
MGVNLSQLQSALDQIRDSRIAAIIVHHAEICAWGHVASQRLEQELKELRTKIIPDLDRRVRTYVPKWLTTKEACQHLKVGRTKLHELIEAGIVVPDRKSGAKNLFSVAHLDNYLALPPHEVSSRLNEWKEQKGRGKLRVA